MGVPRMERLVALTIGGKRGRKSRKGSEDGEDFQNCEERVPQGQTWVITTVGYGQDLS